MDIFISYSHKDRMWKDRVVTFIECMKRHRNIDYETWDDSEIYLSQDWKKTIQQAISKAKVAVLLVSPDSLISKFINDEEVPLLLKRVEKGELALVPVIIRPCPWEVVDWLSRIQLHPSGGKALSHSQDPDIEEHLKQLALEVERLIEQTSTEVEEEKVLETHATPPEAPLISDLYTFLSEQQIKDFIKEREKQPVIAALNIFRIKTQRTWLVAARGWLYCILDSQKTHDGDRLIQWKVRAEPGIRIRARQRSTKKATGLVDIAKKQNWLYSCKLHPDPLELQNKIGDLLKKSLRA